MALTYAGYLELDTLLGLQKPRSAEHDEMLFIVIHQVYELWFKEVLHETDHLAVLLRAGDEPRAAKTLTRILKILKVLVGQLDVLETLTPLEFLSFRDRLDQASGFQSHQFRELEFVLGGKRSEAMAIFPEGGAARRALAARFAAPVLWDAFLLFLARRGHPVPAAALARDVTLPVAPDEAVQEALVRVHREDPAAARVCELFVDLDEGVQEWRYRHVKMVERTIGMKTGTGGSAGASYLRSTLFTPAFPDLWAIRTRF
ncbi:MAG: tryptophan 2,3-dioxygenase family protein [Planctomycetes bacterium]|nr:tryptophan 2,3-dioxygenase family protein [Planctomycetota bacterium]